MLIHPAEPASGYHPQRHPAPGATPAPETDALPDGLIRGRVEALLADGQVRVSAAGRTLLFVPPRPLAPGDLIDLIVVAREPHLVLELVDGTPDNDPAPEISRAATLIGRLSASGMPRPGVIAAAQPLLTAPPAHPPQVASQLAQVVSGSGLFYEAHQAEWVAGTRTWAQLAAEPQARLPQPAPAAGDAVPLPAAETGPQTAARQLHAHPDTLPLVRSQLDTLDSRRLYWCGELWPGQPAEWEIRDRDEDAPPGTTAADHASGIWQTQLRLVLPHLGPVTATFEARGATIGIRIHAAVSDSADAFDAERTALRTALTAAGIAVRELVVTQASPAPRPVLARITGDGAP